MVFTVLTLSQMAHVLAIRSGSKRNRSPESGGIADLPGCLGGGVFGGGDGKGLAAPLQDGVMQR
jgi:hypothetical protein